MENLSPETFVVSAARSRVPGEPLNVPPVLASNYYLPGDRVYARGESTVTIEALEEIVGGLEGGRALAFSTGMAAVAAVLNRYPVGARFAVPEDPYHGVKGLVGEGERQGRWEAIRLNLMDTEGWLQVAQRADLVWIESPANPLITVADLPAICGATRRSGALVAVDSTFATPFVQRPLDYGADIVMHSATKFIGGHSDLLGGLLVTRREDLYEQFVEQRRLAGATMGAMEAFLATRGARTLALRVERAQATALELARRLDSHPEITRVRYPGLPADENHEVAKSFMAGFGPMLSFETAGNGDRATRLCEAARLINHATSLGGVESTMERRAGIPGQETIPETLIRLSVGCENVDDLWSDLEQALETSKQR